MTHDSLGNLVVITKLSIGLLNHAGIFLHAKLLQQLHTTAQTLLQSRLQLLQCKMMLALKARLVNYYLTGEL